MTGPEHYREAERLLGIAGDDHEAQVEKFAEAQVRAILALAAAIVESGSTPPTTQWSDLVWPHLKGTP